MASTHESRPLLEPSNLLEPLDLTEHQAETPTYSFPSAVGRSAPLGSTASSSGLGEAANMPFPISHMLRHVCGFKLANDGHDTRALQHYLGHKNIQHTVRYTEMAPERFKDFWRD
jgi:type 1 fimbriae regulatory protein FimB/type 1 fimbriae regulatory protein FimE